ncbi:MAG TPA: hypothetical protein VFA34_11725 [Actinomycetota bacterium]|jgi:ABC-type phosphate transport system substrate-binding protein|nr:hypothetical protein [Actinomycetota bacterium]
MVRHARKAAEVIAAIGLVVALAGPRAVAVPDNAVQFIRGQGSDGTFDVMQRLDSAYNNSVGCLTVGTSSTDRPKNSTCAASQPSGAAAIPNTENYSHDVALSFFPVGSSHGITILKEFGNPGVTRIDYARSSRARVSADGDSRRFVAYARDGLAWGSFRTGPGDGTSPAAGINTLTVTQLQKIWGDCTIDSWDDVGGPAVPMYVWAQPSSSGTNQSWQVFLGISDSANCVRPVGAPTSTQYKDSNLTNGERVIFENDPKPIRDCAIYAGKTVSPTADAGTNTFTSAGHGWANGEQLTPKTGTGGAVPGGLTVDTHYFVVGATTDTFQLAARPGGPALDITSAGTSPWTLSSGSCPDFFFDPDGDGNGTLYGGTQMSVYWMAYTTYFLWPQPAGAEKAAGFDLGQIDGKSVFNTDSSLNTTDYPALKNIYNVYRATGANPIAPHAYDYIAEDGWICKVSNPSDVPLHATNPRTGANYADEIANIITSSGAGLIPTTLKNINGVSLKTRCLTE